MEENRSIEEISMPKEEGMDYTGQPIEAENLPDSKVETNTPDEMEVIPDSQIITPTDL